MYLEIFLAFGFVISMYKKVIKLYSLKYVYPWIQTGKFHIYAKEVLKNEGIKHFKKKVSKEKGKYCETVKAAK
jgi:hypothetical protein